MWLGGAPSAVSYGIALNRCPEDQIPRYAGLPSSLSNFVGSNDRLKRELFESGLPCTVAIFNILTKRKLSTIGSLEELRDYYRTTVASGCDNPFAISTLVLTSSSQDALQRIHLPHVRRSLRKQFVSSVPAPLTRFPARNLTESISFLSESAERCLQFDQIAACSLLKAFGGTLG